MEILDRLESKIDGLLADISELKTERDLLQEELAEMESLKQKNEKLKEQLNKEQADKSAVVERIDTLLKKLEDTEQSS